MNILSKFRISSHEVTSCPVIYTCFSTFVPSRSHDFIGDFTTSYRELARGQSQFNVYEVSNFTAQFNNVFTAPEIWILGFLDPISDTSDISISDITVAPFPITLVNSCAEIFVLCQKLMHVFDGYRIISPYIAYSGHLYSGLECLCKSPDISSAHVPLFQIQDLFCYYNHLDATHVEIELLAAA